MLHQLSECARDLQCGDNPREGFALMGMHSQDRNLPRGL